MLSYNVKKILDAAIPPPDFEFDSDNGGILRKGYGQMPASIRSTTATVIDFEGHIWLCKIGELRCAGYRRIENLISSSASLTVGNNITLTLTAGDYVFSMGAGASSGVATFSGTGGATGTLTQNVSNRTSVLKTITAGTLVITASVATLVDLQVENVTGCSNQNPSSYISNGVLSAPYHGYDTDGVSYSKYQNGNSVANNAVTEAKGSLIPENLRKGFISELARINLFVKSSEFDDTNWGKQSANIFSSAAVAPDGSYTANKMTGLTDSSEHSIFQAVIPGASAIVTTSLHIKLAEYGRYFRLYTDAPGGDIAIADFDSQNLTYTISSVGGGVGISASIFGVGNGWYRASFTYQLNSSGVYYNHINLRDNANNLIFVGDGVSGMYIWGAQIEVGAFPSSYIPTTTASVTRNSDSLYYHSVSNVVSFQGTVVVEFVSNTSTAFTGFIWATQSDTDNFIALLFDGTNLIARKCISGVNYDATIPFVYTTGTRYKAALSWGKVGVSVALDGVIGTANTNNTQPNIGTNHYIGSDGAGANQAFSFIKRTRYFKKQLTYRQLKELTL